MTGTGAGELPKQIPALSPRGPGHQFVLYGDACSGVAGAPHEETFKSVNEVVSRLSPAPDFIIFPGDEVIGLTADEAALKAQWRYWQEVEMAWLAARAIPLYHSTSNHTCYDRMSERVFREMLPALPRNGPPDQLGLTYFIRRGDLLLIFVNTCFSALGGEGHVETNWLDATLKAYADARYKFVIGHHPVHPVNGFAGDYQRQIGAEHAGPFWDLLVRHKVFAYLCSHILAFDVQVHSGVLQILSAGAGTANRMPAEAEYLHCVQAALDAQGLRYQVIDAAGQVRERLTWPPELPSSTTWQALGAGEQAARVPDLGAAGLTGWRISGRAGKAAAGASETLFSAYSPGPDLAPLWLGLTGANRRLTLSLAPTAGRSPHYWFGPDIAAGEAFDFQFALDPEMGPGGLLWRPDEGGSWSSLTGVSAWGPEQLPTAEYWSVGQGKGGIDDCPFIGDGLKLKVSTPANR